jgi:hypothetical protein
MTLNGTITPNGPILYAVADVERPETGKEDGRGRDRYREIESWKARSGRHRLGAEMRKPRVMGVAGTQRENRFVGLELPKRIPGH